MSPQDEYKVQLDVFEGPLDLLLYLIKKEEVDIYDIPIERITTQYMQYLELMRMLDLNIAGEFLVMAATLMMIKSRMLLPPEDRPELEEEEEDPRWDLVRQLIEYKKFKDAALHLETLESLQQDVFLRGGDAAHLGPQSDVALRDVSIFDLISAFGEVLKRVKTEELREIFAERVTVAEMIESVIQRVKREGRVAFSALFSGMASRAEIICTFLAILELIRLQQIVARQERAFGEILIEQAAAE